MDGITLQLFESISQTREELDLSLIEHINKLDFDNKIEAINKVKMALNEISPFKNEPVDCVLWVNADLVIANDYNPNKVAPPEMQLLEQSIIEDGYTQPIVTWPTEGQYVVVDGFHRNRVGKESKKVFKRINGYLPITRINSDREDKADRIAATIRHNRARGKHTVGGMSDIVLELKRRNWTNQRISKNLGMDEDEILRLCQITGLAELFTNQEFSKSWDIEDSAPDFEPISEEINESAEDKFRAANTNDENRIFHPYEKWECYKAGMYATTKNGMKKEQCEDEYRKFLSDIPRFSDALSHVINEWKFSCEQYLTNSAMNRIAWLGQASMCYATGIPSCFRGGFNLLTEDQQKSANETALIYLNKWLVANNRAEVAMDIALSDNQVNLY